MVSLNDLEAQMGALEDSESEESIASQQEEDEEAEESEDAEEAEGAKEAEDVEEPDVDAEEQVKGATGGDSRVRESRGKGAGKRSEKGQQKGGVKGSGQAPKKKNSKGICFKFLYGACKFDDCKFRHIKPSRLATEDLAEVLQELPLREFKTELRDVIRDLNIPKCKDFHQRGGCLRAHGKCHFWHLTDATVARWAGFDFWCDACSKGFTSDEQMDTHLKGKAHLEAAGRHPKGGGRAGGRAAGRCGRGGGRGGYRGGGRCGASDTRSGEGSSMRGSSGRGWGTGRGWDSGGGRGGQNGSEPPTKRARGRN